MNDSVLCKSYFKSGETCTTVQAYECEDADYEEQINEYLTPREVMELLAIGKNTFYKMVQSGQLPAFRIGRQWRVRRDRLEEL